MPKKILFILILLLFYSRLYSQNLVPNGDFEEFKKPCFKRDGGINEGAALYWFAPSHGTSDWYCKCAVNKINGIGGQYSMSPKPAFGIAHAGFFTYIFTADKRPSREYISVELIDSLEKGEIYHLSFYLRLAEFSDCYTNNIGALFTSDKIWLDDLGPIEIEPSLKNTHLTLDETGRWVFLVFNYTATGNEKFLTIGDFSEAAFPSAYTLKEHSVVPNNSSSYYLEAYYYIDNIKLEKPVP